MEQKNINCLVVPNYNIRILLICVNYNSYTELYEFLRSLNNSVKNSSPLVYMDVHVADNSTEVKDIFISDFLYLNISISRHDNLGYLGAAFYIINSLDCASEYDYIIISNVDLIIDDNFFSELSSIKLLERVGWIAPQIYSQQENRDKNPRMLRRYSKFKLLCLLLMYKCPLLHKIYKETLYKRKKIFSYNNVSDIYAGHGSFVILTKEFFLAYERINYPVFLYGEEIYLAELVRKAKLKVKYIPSLKITDKEHVSTSKMESSFFYKCNIEALSFILKTFY